jgi:hypothetical protein
VHWHVILLCLHFFLSSVPQVEPLLELDTVAGVIASMATSAVTRMSPLHHPSSSDLNNSICASGRLFIPHSRPQTAHPKYQGPNQQFTVERRSWQHPSRRQAQLDAQVRPSACLIRHPRQAVIPKFQTVRSSLLLLQPRQGLRSGLRVPPPRRSVSS